MTRGSSNNLFQVATMVRAATALDATVEVLFSDAALAKLRRQVVNDPTWSAIYAKVLPDMQERLREAEFLAMSEFLRDAKEHGDAVRFWAATESLAEQGLTLSDLVPQIDGERSLAAFLAEVRDADSVLTF